MRQDLLTGGAGGAGVQWKWEGRSGRTDSGWIAGAVRLPPPLSRQHLHHHHRHHCHSNGSSTPCVHIQTGPLLQYDCRQVVGWYQTPMPPQLTLVAQPPLPAPPPPLSSGPTPKRPQPTSQAATSSAAPTTGRARTTSAAWSFPSWSWTRRRSARCGHKKTWCPANGGGGCGSRGLRQ